MEAITKFKEHFEKIEEWRQERKVEHPLINILFIAICGTLCGADSWTEIETFGESQQEWLSQYINLEKGIPSHDTIGRVFGQMDMDKFCEAFSGWMKEVSTISAGEIIAIDGKKLRRSHDHENNKSAIHMVSAWADKNGVVLAQRKVDEKSNEITAIPKLLEVLNLSGCIVTIDAMGCQTDIAEKIIEKQGDYVLSLKGNQGQLHEDVAEMFEYFEKVDYSRIGHSYHKTIGKEHGRIEIRECWVFDPYQWADYFRTLHKWRGLKSVVLVRSQRTVNGKTSTEDRFFISSLVATAQDLLAAIRHHWGIENKLHWVLDMAFDEDRSRIRQGSAPENSAIMRHIALNLLRKESSKASIRRKRLRCALDQAYRSRVLEGFTTLC